MLQATPGGADYAMVSFNNGIRLCPRNMRASMGLSKVIGGPGNRKLETRSFFERTGRGTAYGCRGTRTRRCAPCGPPLKFRAMLSGRLKVMFITYNGGGSYVVYPVNGRFAYCLNGGRGLGASIGNDFSSYVGVKLR